MRWLGGALIICAAIFWGIRTPALSAGVTGAGASFPYPLFAKWTVSYRNATGIEVNYHSIGSGGGISQIEAKTIDFGASEMPLKPEALEKAGLVQFPTVIGGVIPVLNLEGIKPAEIKLSGKVLAGIYLGKISKWNSPEIARLNPGVRLPDKYIGVVHRSDASGTSFAFTNYLSGVSPQWKQVAGTGISVSWPTGVGAKGNEGVASYVQKISGSIGYVEYAYVLQNNMTYALMKNRNGLFVKPGPKSFRAAAAAIRWKELKDFYTVLTDEPGRDSWPITGVTFILMYKDPHDPITAKNTLDFFTWAEMKGEQTANALGYVPMAEGVVKLIRKQWRTEIRGADGRPLEPGL